MKTERIRTKGDFSRLFKTARRLKIHGLQLLYTPNSFQFNRCSVIAARGFPNAIKRNRQKRLVKEVYRSLKTYIKCGYDFIIIVSPFYYSYKEYIEKLRYIFHRVYLFKGSKDDSSADNREELSSII